MTRLILKTVKIIGVSFLAVIALALVMGLFGAIKGSDEEIKDELKIEEKAAPEKVEVEVSEPKVDIVEKPKQPESNLFINDTMAQLEIINAKMMNFAEELVRIGSNPELMNDPETMKDFNAMVDDMERVISIELSQPGDRDGEESAAMYFGMFKEEYSIFLTQLREGVNEQDAAKITKSNEYQMTALSYFEATGSNIAIAVENRDGK